MVKTVLEYPTYMFIFTTFEIQRCPQIFAHKPCVLMLVAMQITHCYYKFKLAIKVIKLISSYCS